VQVPDKRQPGCAANPGKDQDRLADVDPAFRCGQRETGRQGQDERRARRHVDVADDPGGQQPAVRRDARQDQEAACIEGAEIPAQPVGKDKDMQQAKEDSVGHVTSLDLKRYTI
jgi:hypothetical protein